MISVRHTLKGNVKSRQKLSGKLDISTIKIQPELEDITITPTKEQQTFTHENSYGYDNVTVNPIPEEYIIPNLQDKSITITENGTQNITYDEGYDGLGNVEVTTYVAGGSTEEPDYVKDGLIAWFEGEDELVNNTLINRLGDDYIQHIGTVASVRDKVYNPWTKAFGSKAVSNNMSTVFGMSKDYYSTGYTYEAVGEITNSYNDVGSTGGWLFASNTGGGFGIGVCMDYGEVYFLNNTNSTKGKTYWRYYGKRFGASVYTKSVGTRTSPATIYDLECSVNGEPYYSIKQTTASNKSSKASNLSILNYYSFSGTGSKYSTNGHLYSLRIYNRKLTEAEIAHNHEIDKLRFNLDK